MKSCIHFIRHGITQGILNRWYYGWADLPLVDEGYKELEALKAQNIYPVLGNADFYTSGMLRANQTLNTIYGEVAFKPIENLKEMNFGQWECKTFDELKTMDGFDEWVNDKTGSFAFPGGESANDFSARAQMGIDELIGYHRLKELSNRHSGKDSVSVMVCHGGIIASAMCYLGKKPADTFWQWIPKPGRGYTFFFEDGEPVGYEDL